MSADSLDELQLTFEIWQLRYSSTLLAYFVKIDNVFYEIAYSSYIWTGNGPAGGTYGMIKDTDSPYTYCADLGTITIREFDGKFMINPRNKEFFKANKYRKIRTLD